MYYKENIMDENEIKKEIHKLSVTLRTSIKDVEKSLNLLADNGIRASVAGTALREAFLKLKKENKKWKH